MKSKATVFGSISLVFSSIVLVCVRAITMIKKTKITKKYEVDGPSQREEIK